MSQLLFSQRERERDRESGAYERKALILLDLKPLFNGNGNRQIDYGDLDCVNTFYIFSAIVVVGVEQQQ